MPALAPSAPFTSSASAVSASLAGASPLRAFPPGVIRARDVDPLRNHRPLLKVTRTYVFD